MSDHPPVEVLVTPGRCVIWRCQNPADGLACAEHAEGLTLGPAPCQHGVKGRCQRCWENGDPLLLEARRQHRRSDYAELSRDPAWMERERERKRRNQARFRARRRTAKLQAMTIN